MVGLVAIGGALTRAQLVLPQGLLDRVDRGPPRAQQGAAGRGRRRGGRRRRDDRSASTCSASRASSARASRPSSSCRRCSSAPAPGSCSPASRSACPGHRGRRRRHLRARAQAALQELLIVTGVLISLVLVVLVGNTVRTLQGVGWLAITPIDVEFPLWMGTWLGVFPTVESLVAQARRLRLRDRQLLRGRVGAQAPRPPAAARAGCGSRGCEPSPANGQAGAGAERCSGPTAPARSPSANRSYELSAVRHERCRYSRRAARVGGA